MKDLHEQINLLSAQLNESEIQRQDLKEKYDKLLVDLTTRLQLAEKEKERDEYKAGLNRLLPIKYSEGFKAGAQTADAEISDLQKQLSEAREEIEIVRATGKTAVEGLIEMLKRQEVEISDLSTRLKSTEQAAEGLVKALKELERYIIHNVDIRTTNLQSAVKTIKDALSEYNKLIEKR